MRSLAWVPVVAALGKVGLIVAIIGIFAATFGATLEALFATRYDVAPYFGWSYGSAPPPGRPRHRATMIAGAEAGRPDGV